MRLGEWLTLLLLLGLATAAIGGAALAYVRARRRAEREAKVIDLEPRRRRGAA